MLVLAAGSAGSKLITSLLDNVWEIFLDGHVFIWNLLSTRLEKVLYKGGHEYVLAQYITAIALILQEN